MKVLTRSSEQNDICDALPSKKLVIANNSKASAKNYFEFSDMGMVTSSHGSYRRIKVTLTRGSKTKKKSHPTVQVVETITKTGRRRRRLKTGLTFTAADFNETRFETIVAVPIKIDDAWTPYNGKDMPQAIESAMRICASGKVKDLSGNYPDSSTMGMFTLSATQYRNGKMLVKVTN